MRLSRRLTGVLLVLALAGALAPTAFAGRKAASAVVSMVDIEALR